MKLHLQTAAFVFPGQGSQAIGMGRDLAARYPAANQTFEEADAILGFPLSKLMWEGPEAELNETVNTQPAMLTAGYAVYRAWRGLGGREPDIVAGHSLGEYTALVAAGAIAFRDALPLVRFRAQAMQEAVPQGRGAMAAILGLGEEGVRNACAEALGEVQAVNFNAPGQVVIAGEARAVERAIELCKSHGARRAMPLPVSAPFHSTLMRPAAEKLKGYLEKVALVSPAITVVNNVDVKTETDSSKIKDALVRQAASPVRWVEIIRKMRELGVTHVLECGPGKVLAGLTKRISAEMQSFALADRKSLEETLSCLKAS